MEADLAHFFDNFRFTICPESSTPSGRLRRSGLIVTLPFLSLYWVFIKTQFYRKNGTRLRFMGFPNPSTNLFRRWRKPMRH
jgi:hypothetical protein